MRNPRLRLNFVRYKDADLLIMAQGILLSMTNNTAFPDPFPTLSVVKDVITAYSSALTEASDNGRIALAQKRACRQALQKTLWQLGIYVMQAQTNNSAAMISSGFILFKPHGPVYIVNPGTVTLKNGVSSGMLITSVRIVKGARQYQHQITTDPFLSNNMWQSCYSSRSKHTFSNLQPGKQYWARVAVLGTGSQIAYSPVSSKYVL